MQCPTVRIKSSHPEHDGYIVINESDFDKEKHELWAPDPPLPQMVAQRREQISAEAQKEADARKAAFAKSARDVVNLRS